MAKQIPTGPIIAVLLVVAAGAWLLTGSSQGEDTPDQTSESEDRTTLTPSVQVKTLDSEMVQRSQKINAVTKPDRSVSIASEANGRVVEVLKTAGDQVAAGEVIARIDPQDLEARLRSARAYVEQTRLEYEGSQRLGDQGLQNRAQLATSLTQYEEARAQLEALQMSLENTEIKAPFSGVLESSSIEEGSYVRTGDPVAELYDFSPLLVVGQVPETEVASLSVGQPATIRLVTGERMEGTLTFIGAVANPATRTFEVKIAIEDSPKQLAGATAEATVALDRQRAHYISPALLNINDQGQMGLKTLDDNNRVTFTEVRIIRSDTGGVWVAGLPENPRLIVVGQGFVSTGDQVDPVSVTDENDLSAGLR